MELEVAGLGDKGLKARCQAKIRGYKAQCSSKRSDMVGFFLSCVLQGMD